MILEGDEEPKNTKQANNTVHGEVEGGRSQGEVRSRRSQIMGHPTRMNPHGAVTGGRSHGGDLGGGTRETSSCDGADECGDTSGAEQMESQGETGGPRQRLEPEDHGRAEVTEAKVKEELDGARGVEVRGDD